MFSKPKGLEEYSKFPVCRPCKGKHVLVKHTATDEPLRGVGSDCRESGGTIVIDGRRFDSNHVLWWKYDDESTPA